MTVAAATEALAAAYDARDVAEAHALAEVRRMFAPMIARRVQEYQDAVRRAAEAGDDRSALALGNEQETR
jgi:2,4-dienoyl-CoA reductase-like NADH-dependent reductase (Old Yellow Enzyme family)